jgi:hypothetical protein
MIYQLPNGKCIELSTEQYLKMTDQELKNLIASNCGEEFNDPFIFSVLKLIQIKKYKTMEKIILVH